MIKQTLEYEDFNGDTRTETHWFGFTQVELIEWEASVDGGMAGMMQAIVKSEDLKEIIGIFREFVLKAYGVKSADGRHHVKSDELRAEFASSAYYAELYMKLAMDIPYATAFINGVVPAKLAKGLALNKPEGN